MKKTILIKLSDKHKYAAYLLTLGKSTKEVAINVGVQPDTVRQWKKSELFKKEMEKHYGERRVEAMGEFVRQAQDVQKEHLKLCLDEDVPPHVRIKAIVEWENKAGLIITKDKRKDEMKKGMEKLLKQKEQKEAEKFLKDHPEIEDMLKTVLIRAQDSAKSE